MSELNSDALKAAVDDAAAQLLIELAFLVPKGTHLHTHPISEKLTAYKKAIEARAAALAKQEPSGDLQDARDAIKLCQVLSGRPIVTMIWSDVPDSDVDGWIRAVRDLKFASQLRAAQHLPDPPKGAER